MKYNIIYKALDENEAQEIIKFLATKGLYPVGSGFSIMLFVENVYPSVEEILPGLEVDIANKSLYYSNHNYTDNDTFEDYGVLMSIEDMEILEFFDKRGYQLHSSNTEETGQTIEDWWDK